MPKPIGLISATTLLIGMQLCTSASASTTTLQDYLDEVHGKNQEQIGSVVGANAAKLKASGGNLIFMPNLFAETRIGADGKPFNPPLLTYDRIESQSYAVGVSQQFEFGLQTKLYYSLVHTNYVNSPQLTGQPSNYFDVNPTLEASLPLWGNGFGRALRAQETVIVKSNEVEALGLKARAAANDTEAENTYWTLAVAREVLRIQRTALSQAQAILKYVEKQSARRLGEEADVLQARALVAARELELKRAELNSNSIQSHFNALRGEISIQVVDDLEPLPFEAILKFDFPALRPADRYDVQSSRAQVDVTAANSIIATERNTPTVDVFGGFTFNGRDATVGTANTNLTGTYEPTRYVGLKLNVPLDLAATAKVRAGAHMTEDSQRDILQQKLVSQESDWNMSSQEFKDTKDALVLSNGLVQAQELKLTREKTRLKQGKTTTYQVLLFEQDKSQSEIMRAELTRQILGIRASLKLYPAAGNTMEASSR